MNNRLTITKSDDVLLLTNKMKIGEHLAAVMYLPSIISDQSEMGNSFRFLLQKIRGLLEYREYAKDFENLIDRIGRTPQGNMLRALQALGEGPVVITKPNLKMMEALKTKHFNNADCHYIETTAGPVEKFDLYLENYKITMFVNPCSVEGQSFLISLFQFPILTWVVADHVIRSVQQYDARYLSDKCVEASQRALSRKKENEMSFKEAVRLATP